MSDFPSNTNTPLNVPSTPPVVPSTPTEQPRKNLKKIYYIAGGVAALVLVVVFVSALFLFKKPPSSTVPSNQAGLLLSEDANGPIITTAPPAPSRAPNNLSIPINYENKDQRLQLSFGNITRTSNARNNGIFVPQIGVETYTTLQVLDAQNNVVIEDQFVIPSQAIADDLGASKGGVYKAPSGTLTLVEPIPEGSNPVRVTLVSSSGVIYDEASIDYAKMPIALIEQSIKRGMSWLQPPVAHAASNNFVIAVINDADAADRLDQTVTSVKNLLPALGPWSKYEKSFTIVSVPNTVDLGCETLGMIGGQYPFCGDSGKIASIVSSRVPNWNAIAVVTSVDCNCGTVAYNGSSFTSIAALGRQNDFRLVAHEFGHSVGKMTDEYMYRTNSDGMGGPNCFSSQEQCRLYTSGLNKVQCSLGCNTKSSWRPSDGIMNNMYQPLDYWSLEYNLLEAKLLAVIGSTTPSATPSTSPGPSSSPASTPTQAPRPSNCPVCPTCGTPTPSPVSSPSPSPSRSPSPSPSPQPVCLNGASGKGIAINGVCWYLGEDKCSDSSCWSVCQRAGTSCSPSSVQGNWYEGGGAYGCNSSVNSCMDSAVNPGNKKYQYYPTWTSLNTCLEAAKQFGLNIKDTLNIKTPPPLEVRQSEWSTNNCLYNLSSHLLEIVDFWRQGGPSPSTYKGKRQLCACNYAGKYIDGRCTVDSMMGTVPIRVLDVPLPWWYSQPPYHCQGPFLQWGQTTPYYVQAGDASQNQAQAGQMYIPQGPAPTYVYQARKPIYLPPVAPVTPRPVATYNPVIQRTPVPTYSTQYWPTPTPLATPTPAASCPPCPICPIPTVYPTPSPVPSSSPIPSASPSTSNPYYFDTGPNGFPVPASPVPVIAD